MPGLQQGSGASALLAAGWQDGVAKEREEAGNRIDVQLAALRLPAVGTDLLISLSSGSVLSAGSSAAGAAGPGRGAAVAAAPGLMRAMLRSLAIRDYGLFGHEG